MTVGLGNRIRTCSNYLRVNFLEDVSVDERGSPAGYVGNFLPGRHKRCAPLTYSESDSPSSEPDLLRSVRVAL